MSVSERLVAHVADVEPRLPPKAAVPRNHARHSLEAWSYSARNKRERNEDSYIHFNIPRRNASPLQVFVVADGMGGHSAGELASKRGTISFARSMLTSCATDIEAPVHPLKDSARVAAFARRALLDAHDITRAANDRSETGFSGSTLSAIVTVDDHVIAVGLGDSPVFLFRASDRVLVRLTPDHSLAGLMVEAGRLHEDQSTLHPGRHQLVYHLGCEELPIIQPRVVTLSEGDLLLAGSDGALARLTNAEIRAHLDSAGGKRLRDVGHAIIQHANLLGEDDNQTIVVIRPSRRRVAGGIAHG